MKKYIIDEVGFYTRPVKKPHNFIIALGYFALLCWITWALYMILDTQLGLTLLK